MSADGDGARSGKSRVRVGPFGLAAGVFALRSASRKHIQDEQPSIVSRGKRISRLQALAEQLAADGREDQAAVDQLATLARGNSTKLLQAAAVVRAFGHGNEDLITYRANELLQAAAGGRPVRRVTADQQEWFDQLDRLLADPPESAYDRVRQMQPDLARVEAAMREAATDPEVPEVGSPAWHAVREQVDRELDPLVGPNATAGDPLLRTRRVHDLVSTHLLRIAYRLA